MRTSTPTKFHRTCRGGLYIRPWQSQFRGCLPGRIYNAPLQTRRRFAIHPDFQTFPLVLTGEILSKISPQGLCTVECFLWKSPRRFAGNFPLWKGRNLSTRGCGGAALAIPGFAPLFHIKSYYYCCCYIYPLFLLERKTANAPIFPGAVENPAAQRRLIYEIFLR